MRPTAKGTPPQTIAGVSFSPFCRISDQPSGRCHRAAGACPRPDGAERHSGSVLMEEVQKKNKIQIRGGQGGSLPFEHEVPQQAGPLSAGIPARQQPYRGPGRPAAPGCGEVSAGAAPLSALLPPHRPTAAVRVGRRERRGAWRLLSAEFCLLPLLYEHISQGSEQGKSPAAGGASILSASILGLRLLRAVISGEGATGLQTGLSSVGPPGRVKYRLAAARDFSSPYENRVASECQPSLPVSSQLHHGIKLLIPFIPFWE